MKKILRVTFFLLFSHLLFISCQEDEFLREAESAEPDSTESRALEEDIDGPDTLTPQEIGYFSLQGLPSSATCVWTVQVNEWDYAEIVGHGPSLVISFPTVGKRIITATAHYDGTIYVIHHTVTVSDAQIPTTSIWITGTTKPKAFSVHTYLFDATKWDLDKFRVEWIISSGDIISGQGTSSINVMFYENVSRYVDVRIYDRNGQRVSSGSKLVQIQAGSPQFTATLTGENQVPWNSTKDYSLAINTNLPNYVLEWTPYECALVSGAHDPSVRVNFNKRGVATIVAKISIPNTSVAFTKSLTITVYECTVCKKHPCICNGPAILPFQFTLKHMDSERVFFRVQVFKVNPNGSIDFSMNPIVRYATLQGYGDQLNINTTLPQGQYLIEMDTPDLYPGEDTYYARDITRFGIGNYGQKVTVSYNMGMFYDFNETLIRE